MNAQAGKYFEPIREINALALDNVEKLLDIQLKSINDTTRQAVERMKSATEINDADSLKKYFVDQTELVKSLGERFIKDSQTAMELGVSYTDKVQQIVTESIKPDVPVPAATATTAQAAPKSK